MTESSSNLENKKNKKSSSNKHKSDTPNESPKKIDPKTLNDTKINYAESPMLSSFQKHLVMTRLEETNSMKKDKNLAGFTRNTKIFITLLVTFIFFILLGFFSIYWVNYLSTNNLLNLEKTTAYLLELGDGRLVELVMWVLGVFGATCILTFGVELIHRTRFVIYRAVLCVVQLAVFVLVACLAIYSISFIFAEGSDIRNILEDPKAMVITSIFAAFISIIASYYWILKFYPKNANNVPVYDAPIEMSDSKGRAEMQGLSSAFKLVDDHIPNNTSQHLAMQKRLREMEKKDIRGRNRTQYLFSIVVGIWAAAFSIILCAFFVYGDSITLENLSSIFNHIAYNGGDTLNLASVFIFFFTIMFAFWTYIGFGKIVSFFMGSIIGEIRNGSKIWFCVKQSIYKTFENIPMLIYRSIGVLKGFVWPFLMVLSLSGVLFTYLIGLVRGGKFVKNKPKEEKESKLRAFIFKIAIMISGIFVFDTFFKYFALGMYPKNSIRERVQEDFFDERKYITNIMGWVVIAFVAILIVICLAMVISYLMSNESKTVDSATTLNPLTNPALDASKTSANAFYSPANVFKVLRYVFAFMLLTLLILPVAIFSLSDRKSLENYRAFRKNASSNALEYQPHI
ncbi:hypothetical protein NEFER03_0982 [Nematocida sp. LUAm3]|nr:hypothetical protein NEFER03_0982 [Nematocida sp. LUAm3]KAI5175414.1 hypothetical protein NEFER02_1343 [Nematocida sp. LUAm2]KAI5177629.1 hypothetical protein NEFER01_0853 [Nematocida sp. LUAm1]